MSDAADFYQIHLDRVSRSFAFCIRQLNSPLREWVALSYLLCRVVDTIEDAPWPELTAQMHHFARFDRALLDPAQLDLVEGWAEEFPAISAHERDLLRDAPRLMRDLHALPTSVHESIRNLVHSMSQGMQHFCRTRDSGGPLYLRSLHEVNQYCFFVAGIVGELLANLVAKVEPRFPLNQLNLVRAHHFGLFLQKVNLLKDQIADERVGRHLIPSRELVEDSAQENAQSALEFIVELPAEQVEFRRFCAWSLFLGLEALRVARSSRSADAVVKVPRARTAEILGLVEGALTDERALRSLFVSFAEALGWRATTARPWVAKALDVPGWLLNLYRGLLDRAALQALGISASV